LRAFHHQVGAAATHRQLERAGRLLQRIAKPRADRMRHRDMRHDALTEKALLTGEAAVDELIDDDEMPRRQVSFQAAGPPTATARR